MKVRIGDRVEWRRGEAKLVGEVTGFDNRSAMIVDDGGMKYSVPTRELTVVEKRTSP